jgi:hypothetical protein
MLPSPLSFIFKLGKHQSLQFRPLRQLSVEDQGARLPPAISPMTRDVPLRNEPEHHSNQMSSQALLTGWRARKNSLDAAMPKT